MKARDLTKRKTKVGVDDWQKDWTCTQQELLVFTRQLATLVKSGVPIVPSLDALSASELGHLSATTSEIAEKLQNGWGLAKSLTLFPKIFSKVYVGMIRIAEKTGALHQALDDLAGWIESDLRVLRKAKSVLTYPAIVLVVTLILTVALFTGVMPGFVKIFNEMNAELPLLTEILVFITKTLTTGWGWAAIILVTATVIRVSLPFLRSEKGQLRIFRLLLVLPVLGPTLQTLTIGRFCAAAALMIPSGASLLLVMKLAAIASGSPVLVEDTEQVQKALSEGEYLGEYMATKPHIYPSSLAQVVIVGETTSRLDYILDKFATLYQDEVDLRLDNLASILEPIVLTLAAVVVGTVLLGVFLPLYGFLGKL